MRLSKKKIVWILTSRGLGSEINNLVYARNYADKHNMDLVTISSFWNFSIKVGLGDYFKLSENKDIRINFLMFLFKRFFSPLTHCYEKTSFFNLVKEIYISFILKRKSNYPLNEALLTYAFNVIKSLLGIRSVLIFEAFKDVRSYNYQNKAENEELFFRKMNYMLLDIWNFQPEILELIQERMGTTRLNRNCPYAVFHIRRGDKVAEDTMEDRVYHVDEYMEKLVGLDKNIKSILIMSDDYNVFLEIKKKYPNFDFFTLSEPAAQGHDQHTFNKKSKKYKMDQAVNLFSEIEIARECQILIGSSGSNIFRLIEYLKLEDCYDLSNSSDI